MKTAAKLLQILNHLVSFAEICLLLLVALFAIYALMDNRQVYQAAGDIQESMLQYKPALSADGESEDRKPNFTALWEINPDICGWITMDGTAIDFPVVQGNSNLDYLNINAYGEYELSGSIFLDTRNAGDWSDPYCLLYGHQIVKHHMFGDLGLYRDHDFFQKNRTGILILPDRVLNLQVLACLQASAAETRIFDPVQANAQLEDLPAWIRTHAEDCNEELLLEFEKTPGWKTIALTTCSDDFTDSRTVVLALAEEI